MNANNADHAEDSRRVIATSLVDTFRAAYGADPSGVWSAPGRVNLIGEHTDYNHGLCLPVAIPRRTFVAARRRADRQIRIASIQVPGEERTVSLDTIAQGSAGGWAAYSAGVLWALEQAGHAIGGLDVVVDGRVPLGSGLSSSAALECATAAAAVDLFELRGLDDESGRRRLVAACIRAENEIAGAPTGGMDQSAALLSAPDTALLLDFDGDHPPHRVPFELTARGLEVLVMNTRAAHALGDGQYGNRRQECETAVRELGVPSLRAIAPVDLDTTLARLSSDVLRRRVRHVVTEIARVVDAVAALESGELDRLTGIFDASHASMRDDYEISCAELDLAVDTARATGALAARMTGGGFGGSAIAVIETARREEIRSAVERAFEAARFREPELFTITADGPAAREL
ncbi:MAG: galactokinase [Micrococcales bacterium]|nr:galactokinase [Micrococcales bacterium]